MITVYSIFFDYEKFAFKSEYNKKKLFIFKHKTIETILQTLLIKDLNLHVHCTVYDILPGSLQNKPSRQVC